MPFGLPVTLALPGGEIPRCPPSPGTKLYSYASELGMSLIFISQPQLRLFLELP